MTVIFTGSFLCFNDGKNHLYFLSDLCFPVSVGAMLHHLFGSKMTILLFHNKVVTIGQILDEWTNPGAFSPHSSYVSFQQDCLPKKYLNTIEYKSYSIINTAITSNHRQIGVNIIALLNRF